MYNNYSILTKRLLIAFTARVKLSGIAKEESEFYLMDTADDRPRVRFTIVNDYLEPPMLIVGKT